MPEKLRLRQLVDCFKPPCGRKQGGVNYSRNATAFESAPLTVLDDGAAIVFYA
jgi:hypothetical protein